MRTVFRGNYFTLMISLLGVFFATAVSAADVEVKHAYARATPPVAQNSAAYMQLHNHSEEKIVIVSASSTKIRKVEFHTHQQHNGTMRMTKVEKITVPAHGEFHFMPGQHHIMLMGLSAPLSVGDTLPLELKLSNGKTIDIELPVKPVGHKMGEHKMNERQMNGHKAGGHSH